MSEDSKGYRVQIIVAIIGLVGVLGAAIIPPLIERRGRTTTPHSYGETKPEAEPEPKAEPEPEPKAELVKLDLLQSEPEPEPKPEPVKEEHGKPFAHSDEDWNCQKCHPAQDSMYQGTVKLVAEAMPSIKAESVDCSVCHMSTVENGVGSLDEIKEMCVECHESGYDETLDGWQEMIRDEITEAEGLLSDVAALLKKSEDKPQKQQASSLYEEAKKRVLFVQEDGSSGAHNVGLANQLLTDAIDSLKRCQQLLK